MHARVSGIRPSNQNLLQISFGGTFTAYQVSRDFLPKSHAFFFEKYLINDYETIKKQRAETALRSCNVRAVQWWHHKRPR